MATKFTKELPVSDSRPHDAFIAELQERPNEWALALEADDITAAEYRARVLRRKGAKCSIRTVDGTPQVWAMWEA